MTTVSGFKCLPEVLLPLEDRRGLRSIVLCLAVLPHSRPSIPCTNGPVIRRQCFQNMTCWTTFFTCGNASKQVANPRRCNTPASRCSSEEAPSRCNSDHSCVYSCVSPRCSEARSWFTRLLYKFTLHRCCRQHAYALPEEQP